MLEAVGSSPIIHTSSLNKGRLAERIQAVDCKSIYTGSIPVATSKICRSGATGRHGALKTRVT